MKAGLYHWLGGILLSSLFIAALALAQALE